MNSTQYVTIAVVGISFVICVFLFWLIYFSPGYENTFFDYSILSGLNAVLNTCASVCLIIGLRHIKHKNKDKHKKWMISAFVFSSLFLISYLIYHTFHGDTKFAATGVVRYVYFFVLISHILLSVVALPLILMSFYLSLSGKFPLHKKVSRITFPIWLYVSVTGVLVYFFIRIFN